jgi:methyl-accepting chemotaxis protein
MLKLGNYSLKKRLFLLFIGVSLIVSIIAGLMMYFEYSRFIKYTWTNTLQKALKMADQLLPEIYDDSVDSLMAKAASNSDEYWRMNEKTRYIAEAFNLDYVYFTTRTGNRYRSVFSSEYERGTVPNLDYDDPNELMIRAFDTRTLQISTKAYTDEWGTFVSAYVPVMQNGQFVGVWGVDFPYDYINSLQARARNIFLIVLVLCVVIAGGFSLRISSNLIRPIRELRDAAASLAQMNFDIWLAKMRKDEIGEMQKALVGIRKNLKKTFEDLNSNLAKTAENEKKLSAIVSDSISNLDVINESMGTLEEESHVQSESVKNTAQSVDAITKSIDSLNGAVKSQVSHILESSASIEEMVTNIDDIRESMQTSKSIMQKLGASSASGHSMLLKLTEEVKHIHEQSATLQNANKSISEIAATTNLLAMNAAIEAAHAGEAGRGFAVVAGEVRKLAELSASQSKNIADEVKKMEQRIELMNAASGQTTDVMNQIFNSIEEIGSAFQTVNNAIEQQSAGGSKILSALKAIQQESSQVREGSGTIHRQSFSIHQEIETLQQISQNVEQHAHEMKEASSKIVSSLKQAPV